MWYPTHAYESDSSSLQTLVSHHLIDPEIRARAYEPRTMDPLAPINLFNISWRDTKNKIQYAVLPPELTGVETPIAVLMAHLTSPPPPLPPRPRRRGLGDLVVDGAVAVADRRPHHPAIGENLLLNEGIAIVSGGEEPAELQGADADDRTEARDGGHRALVEVLERRRRGLAVEARRDDLRGIPRTLDGDLCNAGKDVEGHEVTDDDDTRPGVPVRPLAYAGVSR